MCIMSMVIVREVKLHFTIYDGCALFLWGSDTSSYIPKVWRDDVQLTRVIPDGTSDVIR